MLVGVGDLALLRRFIIAPSAAVCDARPCFDCVPLHRLPAPSWGPRRDGSYAQRSHPVLDLRRWTGCSLAVLLSPSLARSLSPSLFSLALSLSSVTLSLASLSSLSSLPLSLLSILSLSLSLFSLLSILSIFSISLLSLLSHLETPQDYGLTSYAQ